MTVNGTGAGPDLLRMATVYERTAEVLEECASIFERRLAWEQRSGRGRSLSDRSTLMLSELRHRADAARQAAQRARHAAAKTRPQAGSATRRTAPRLASCPGAPPRSR
jgi:hypothetical protein